MTIKGIENTDDKVAKSILNFIYDNFNDEEEINIEKKSDYLYSINDKEYVIIPEFNEYDLLDTYNDNLFEDVLYDSVNDPDYWKTYIDKRKWIDDNGITDIVDYWSEIEGYTIDYVDCYNRIEFYKVL